MAYQANLRFPALLLVILGIASASPSVPQASERVSEQEEVTAIDLVVELSRDGETAITVPSELTPSDFIVTEDGRRLTVVGGNLGPPIDPWHVLVYFDLEFTSVATVRWAASALADSSAALVDLGQVEVMVADPEPRTLLGATRDAELLEQTLSGVYLGNARHAQVALREEFLLARDSDPELATPVAASRVLAEEQQRVISRLDDLLDLLVADTPATSRRALLLVSDGFDGKPQEFYAAYGGAGTGHPVTRAVEEWSRTVAAYAWTVIVLAVPPRQEARVYGLVPSYMEDFEAIGFEAPGLTARLDGSFDPERAAASHELGQRLAEQSKWEEAEAELRKALGYYHDSPKYARQRAAVLGDLGDVLLAQGRTAEARDAMRTSVALDGERASRYPFLEGRLVEPAAPLEVLIADAAGRITRDAAELAAAIDALARRVRLTLQLEGPPDGRLHPVELTLTRTGLSALAPRWVRFGTPPSVDALRARRLLDGRMEEGDLELQVRFDESGRGYGERRGELIVEVVDPAVAAELTARPLRATIGLAAEEGPAEVSTREVSINERVIAMPLTVADDQLWAAVVITDPRSGRWGAATTEP